MSGVNAARASRGESRANEARGMMVDQIRGSCRMESGFCSQ